MSKPAVQAAAAIPGLAGGAQSRLPVAKVRGGHDGPYQRQRVVMRYGNTTLTGEVGTEYDRDWAAKLYDSFWNDLQTMEVKELKRARDDLMTWRRGSAQMVLKVNPALNNLSIYSVLVTGVEPSIELYRHLLHYNILQRRESLGLFEKGGKLYIVLKYTMELELVNDEVLGRHVYALQEIADQLDTELVNQFGGTLHFEDWERLDQTGVDSLLESMFG